MTITFQFFPVALLLTFSVLMIGIGMLIDAYFFNEKPSNKKA